MHEFKEKYPLPVCEEMGDIAAEAFEKFKRTVDSSTEPGEEDMLVKWDIDLLKKMSSECDESGVRWAYIPDRFTIKRSVNSYVLSDVAS